MLKINISSLIKGQQEEILVDETIKKFPKEIKLSIPLSVSGRIYKSGDAFMAELDLQGEEELKCDRCADNYFRKINHFFSQEYVIPGKAKGEEEYDEKAGFIVSDKNEIDLEEAILEEIAVEDMSQKLCHEECLGLCVKCGTNLNKNKCSCYTKKIKKNPFDKLKELKEKK